MKKLETTITRLEMLEAPSFKQNKIMPPLDCALLRVDKSPLHFYRYIYNQVGMKHYWMSRKKLNDEELAEIIHDPQVEIYILYQNGAPAGFAEMDFRKPKIGDIVFLGLMEEKIGMGLGSFLLNEMIKTAWDRDIKKLIIETCTLDHPRALMLYQRFGFTPYERCSTALEIYG